MAGEPGFLILSHQKLSMVPAVSSALRRRGITSHVLSSRPSREVDSGWESEVGTVRVTDGHALDASDVDLFMKELTAAGVHLLGCLSVWDAYRGLMARANRAIGATDLGEETIARLRDKLAMRTALREAGLSAVDAWPFEEARFAALADRSRYFVKPRAGMASLGAFRADLLGAPEDLSQVWAQTAGDTAYAGAFDGEPAFVVEEFIEGTECSFEVCVHDGTPVVHAVHEKVDLRQSGRTTLENACACPPVSVGADAVREGADHVARCLRALGVHTGVHHVEARRTPSGGWEIVEVNARIGGACIVPSTRLHSGADLLDHWVDLVLGRLPQEPESPVRSTFFRVFFGEPGRVVSRLERRPGRIETVEEKVFVHEGEKLPDVDREIFLGQALWDTTGLTAGELSAFIGRTESYLDIEYRR
jgi:hypothetical protein